MSELVQQLARNMPLREVYFVHICDLNSGNREFFINRTLVGARKAAVQYLRNLVGWENWDDKKGREFIEAANKRKWLKAIQIAEDAEWYVGITKMKVGD